MKSGVWIALATAVLLTALWDTQVVLPFKMLVVLVHEMWHGLTAMAAGATIDRIILHPGESGETLVRNLRGVWGVMLSVSAGYAGSALTGALLLRRGLVESFERLILAVFAGLVLYMTALFTAPGGLAFTTGLGWSLALLFAAALGDRYARNALLVIGTVFLWYSFFDLFDFTRDARQTDAGILAKYLKSRMQMTSSIQYLSVVISSLWVLGMLGTVWSLLGSIIILPPAPQSPAPAPEPQPSGGPASAPAQATAGAGHAPALAPSSPPGPAGSPPAPAAPAAAPATGSPTSAVISNQDMAELMALRAELAKDKNLQASPSR